MMKQVFVVLGKYQEQKILWKNGFSCLVPQWQIRKEINIIKISYLGYVWFSENLKENARERKYKGKVEGNKK